MNDYIKSLKVNEINSVETFNHSVILSKIKTGNYFSVFHCNVRSINKNFEKFLMLIHESNYCYDVIVFSETWKVPDINFFNIDGYTVVYSGGQINQNDGTMVYIKDVHKKSLNINIGNIGELRIIQIEIIVADGKKLLLDALYRPYETCPQDFVNNLRSYLEIQTLKNSTYQYLVGDINIDIMSNKTISSDYLNLLAEMGYVSSINSYTRVKNGSKTCIDHIFVKGSDNDNHYSFILQNDITDHFPIVDLLEIEDTNASIPEKTLIKKLDKEKLIKLVRSSDKWHDFYQELNIDRMAEIFTSILRYSIDQSTSESFLKHKFKKRNPWITQALIKSTQEKQNLYKSMLNDPNNLEKKVKFKRYKDKLNKLIYEAKQLYFRNKLNTTENNSKRLWSVVNTFSGKKTKENNIKELNCNGRQIQNKQQIANYFNDFYSNLGKKLADKITKSPPTTIKTKSITNSIFFYETDPQEVEFYINELKCNKSPGFDLITSEILKLLIQEVKFPLSYLINKILNDGYFPKSFKIGLIKPLHKKGSKDTVENYRPITLTSSLSKVVEKIIKKRIVCYFEKYNIISKKQFGFKKGVSTEDAIIYLTSNIYKNLDKNKKVIAIFLDLAKAFDTVDHNIMVEVFEGLGFRGPALNLIKSYLNDRIQYVQIDKYISNPRPVTYGVPQGTVLGPILFAAYMNGLLEIQSAGNISSFADDTVVCYSADTWNETKLILEKDLLNILNWFNKMSLTVNFDKTKYVTFCCNRSTMPNFNLISISQNNSEIIIEEATSVKYLGIEIDKFLKWNLHITNLVKKLRLFLYKIKKLRNILNISQLKQIYFALIYSMIQYGITAWGNAYDAHLKQLETIQKQVIKIMYKHKTTYPTECLYSESSLLDIKQIYVFKVLFLQHKVKHELDNISHDHCTRYKKSSQTKSLKASKRLSQRSFCFVGSRMYPRVPDNVKNIIYIKLFKSELMKWIISIPRLTIRKYINPMYQY